MHPIILTMAIGLKSSRYQLLANNVLSLKDETGEWETKLLKIEQIFSSKDYREQRGYNLKGDEELRLELIKNGFCGKFLIDELLDDKTKKRMWWVAFESGNGFPKYDTKPCQELRSILYLDLNGGGKFTKNLIELSMEESEDDFLFHIVLRVSTVSTDFQLGLEYDIFEHTPEPLSDDYLERWADLCEWSGIKFNTERASRLKTIVHSRRFQAARDFISLREGGTRLKQRLRKNINRLYAAEAGAYSIDEKKSTIRHTLADFKLKSDAITALDSLKMDEKYNSVISEWKNNLDCACYCLNDSNRLTSTKCCQQLIHPDCKIQNSRFQKGCAFCRSLNE